jgi:hypothetical protein
MRLSTVIAFSTLASASAFVPRSLPASIAPQALHVAVDPSYHTAGSGMTVNTIPTMIDHLTEDNFEQSLEMMESFLVDEASLKEYRGLMQALHSKCDEIGKSIPKGYALYKVGPVTHIAKEFTAGSGMNVQTIPTMIDHLTEDNFDESLEMMEPLLVNEATLTEYLGFIKVLKARCETIGKSIPEGYAHHA